MIYNIKNIAIRLKYNDLSTDTIFSLVYEINTKKEICKSTELPWSYSIIDRYIDELDINELCKNIAVPWSKELIELLFNYINWDNLSRNLSINWDIYLLKEYSNFLNFKIIIENPNLSDNCKKYIYEHFTDINSYRPNNLVLDLPFKFYQSMKSNTKTEFSMSEPNWSLSYIKNNIDKLNVYELCKNTKVTWSKELMDFLFDYIDWNNLSSNIAVKWNLDILMRFSKNLNLKLVAENTNLNEESKNFICEQLFNKYIPTSHYRDLNIPFTIDFIDKNKNVINWFQFSYNSHIPWSKTILEKFRNYWELNVLSENPYLPWSIELIATFEDNWNWFYLSRNPHIPWSIELIEHFINNWNWNELSHNKYIPWSIDFLKNKFDKLCLTNLSGKYWPYSSLKYITSKEVAYIMELCWDGLSGNLLIPWSLDLINLFFDKWNWEKLSNNPSLPWSLDFINAFKDKWDWRALSSCPLLKLPWSVELLGKFKDKWKWTSDYIECGSIHYNKNPYGSISANKSITWNLKLIEPFIDEIDFWLLSLKGNINFDIVDIYMDKWEFSRVLEVHGLRDSDFGYIIEYEVTSGWDNLSKNQSLIWTDCMIKKYKNKVNFFNLAKFGKLNISHFGVDIFPDEATIFYLDFSSTHRKVSIYPILKERGYKSTKKK